MRDGLRVVVIFWMEGWMGDCFCALGGWTDGRECVDGKGKYYIGAVTAMLEEDTGRLTP